MAENDLHHFGKSRYTKACVMIPVVNLPRTKLKTSRLAFGTSRLHYVSKSKGQSLLSAAADLGFMHFDTAPIYGDGLAERELGRFMRGGRRDRFLIATKYGIPPDPVIEAWPHLAQPLRGCRAVARRLGLWVNPLPPMTAAGLRESAEQSLRRLGTDWIDVLFLHEPSPERVEDVEEIVEELDRLTQRGLIRAFGLAGAWSGISRLLAAAPGLGLVVQTAEADWPPASPPDITYGVIAHAAQSFLAAGTDRNIAMARLRSALSRRVQGVVLVSTTKMHNLNLLAKTAEESQHDN